MTKKKPEKLDMRKELRITGDRPPPRLPVLSREDFVLGLWDAIHEPYWTISQAAHYMHEVMPGAVHDAKTIKEVERTRFWLEKEYTKSTGAAVDENFKLTPGDIMRFLWESRRPVSLKVWALYYLLDKGEIDFRIEAHILERRYVRAAEIFWEELPEATVEEVAGFLSVLPYEARDESGLPLFASRSLDTLKDYIRHKAKLKRGRRPNSKKLNIGEHRMQLIDLIIKEIGN